MGRVNVGGRTAKGNAVNSDLLAGKTAESANGSLVGTISVKTGYNQATQITSSPGGVYLKAPEGYYNGNAFVEGDDPDFISANFRSDKNLFGLQGTMPVATKDVVGVFNTAGMPSHADVYSGNIDFYKSHDGYAPAGYLRRNFANLTPANIKAGVTISDGVGAGITGTAQTFLVSPGDNPMMQGIFSGGDIYDGSSVPIGERGAVTIKLAGTYRISFYIWDNNSSSGAYARIYVNGVAAGTQRTGSGVTYTEDIYIPANARLSIYSWRTNSGWISVRSWSIYYNANDIVPTILIP